MPALSLAAVPGRRKAMLEIAQEAERHGFTGIYGPSLGDALSLCVGLSLTTRKIPFGTTITPIYTRHVADFAATVSTIHELSGGRFRFGIGVSHAPMHARLGLEVGKPLADIRRFVDELRAVPRVGPLPPITLAALRDRMIRLATEIGDGLVFANGARSHMAHSLRLIGERREDPSFFIGNMIPTVVHDDERAAAEVHRRTLTGYVALPNYRNYWKAAGYVEEMEAIEQALDSGDPEDVRAAMSDRWLEDVTLFGSAKRVREGVEAWLDAGVKTPILVPSSVEGNQLKAIEELFATFGG